MKKKQKPTAQPQLTYKDTIKCCKYTHFRSLFFTATSCWQQTFKDKTAPSGLLHTPYTSHSKALIEQDLNFHCWLLSIFSFPKADVTWHFSLQNGDLCRPLEKEAKSNTKKIQMTTKILWCHATQMTENIKYCNLL